MYSAGITRILLDFFLNIRVISLKCNLRLNQIAWVVGEFIRIRIMYYRLSIVMGLSFKFTL